MQGKFLNSFIFFYYLKIEERQEVGIILGVDGAQTRAKHELNQLLIALLNHSCFCIPLES